MTIYIYWFRTFSYVGRFLRTTPGLGRGAACTFAHCPVCKDHINASPQSMTWTSKLHRKHPKTRAAERP
jgi:hypothetical protein